MTDTNSDGSGVVRPNESASRRTSLMVGLQVVEKTECLSLDYIQKVQQNSKTSFNFDPEFSSGVINLSAGGRHIFLSEDTYLFRTSIASPGFEEGTHYWEIVADARTENELKIGVVKNRDIDLKTAFSDYSSGWAYYATG